MDDKNISATYEAGVCNIGPDEIHKRERIGYLGTALALLFVVAAEWFEFPQMWKLALFAPVVYAVAGYVQARRKFCFLFGIGGVSKVNQHYDRVNDPHFRSSDIRNALKMIGVIVLISTIITLGYVFLS